MANGGFDELWALGDLVGYGPDPAACIDLLKAARCPLCGGQPRPGSLRQAGPGDVQRVRGSSGDMDHPASWAKTDVEVPARAAASRLEMHGFTAVHGSPRDPVWEYVVNSVAALAAFEDIVTPRCLVGHSHVPFICRLEERRSPPFRLATTGPGRCWENGRAIVNPGSVGQPQRRRPQSQLRGLRLRRGDDNSLPGAVRHPGNPAQDARARPATLPCRASNLRPVSAATYANSFWAHRKAVIGTKIDERRPNPSFRPPSRNPVPRPLPRTMLQPRTRRPFSSLGVPVATGMSDWYENTVRQL